jgi:hypothetical protein
MTSKEDIKIMGMPVRCRNPSSKIARSIANRQASLRARLAIPIAGSN